MKSLLKAMNVSFDMKTAAGIVTVYVGTKWALQHNPAEQYLVTDIKDGEMIYTRTAAGKLRQTIGGIFKGSKHTPFVAINILEDE